MDSPPKKNGYYQAETAIVETKDIGEGTRIWNFAHIRQGARIGKKCIIGDNVYIDKDVKIEDNVKIENGVSIYKGVIIENDVFIGPSVMFTNDLYPRSFIWSEDMIKPTLIKMGASIGANSTIICGIQIGEYSMIGAGSVVTTNVPPYALAFGTPARLKSLVCKCGAKITRECALMISEKSMEYKCSNCLKKKE